MHKTILATLESFEGLPADVVEKLKQQAYANDQIFEVKKIELANGSYRVWIEAVSKSGKSSFMVNAENVNLYERYDDDYKVYNPLEDQELVGQKEKGEN